MTTLATAPPVELIAPAPQTLWGWPAVANFALGGLGAGLYVAAAVGAGFRASPALTVASWLGPVLVLGGFAAVGLEAGRPVRGPRVLTQVATSWMSRELWLGILFVGLAAVGVAVDRPTLRLGAAVAAVGLALSQGFILREARGVPAWGVPVMPSLFLASGLVSGVAGLVLVELARGQTPGRRLLGAVLVLLLAWVLAWWSYLTWSADPAFARDLEALRGGRGALVLVGGGYLVPSLAIALALALPPLEVPLAALGAAAIVGSQIQLKAKLILTAGRFRAIALGSLSLGQSGRRA